MSDEIDDDTEITISHKMPAWMRQLLAANGFSYSFKFGELTEEQQNLTVFVHSLHELELKGLCKIRYDPKIHKTPEVSLTRKGVEAAKKLEKRRGC